MITKKEAIVIGTAIVQACQREVLHNEGNATVRYHVNGVCGYALDNLWYDVLSNKVKAQFDYDNAAFKNLVWPETTP